MDAATKDPTRDSTWSSFREHFTKNRERALPHLVRDHGLKAAAARELAHALARFQLGETGEGRIAHQIEHFRHPAIDDDYRAALRLFIGEEGRHARILGVALRTLDGKPLTRHWTASWFTRARGLFGVRFKLLVLLAAETVAIAAYGELAVKLPPSSLRAALEQVLADERVHLQFHDAFFRRILATSSGQKMFPLLLALFSELALALMMFDQRRLLSAFDISPAALRQRSRVALRSLGAHRDAPRRPRRPGIASMAP